MQLRSLILFFILVVPVFSFAQGGRQNNQPQQRNDYEPSSLSVYSETGEQFFLVLNGVNQNNAPTSRIRVEGLPQYGNDIEIIFADRRTQAIRKRITIADPVDGNAVDMTLRLTRERDGFPRLKFFKCVEAERNYRGQRDEYVMYYGRSDRNNTTTTTTTTTYNNTPQGPVAMDPRSFSEAKNTISASSFESTKYSTAKTILGTNYFTTNQVIELCKLFSFEHTRLAFAKDAYSRTIDANNYYKVGSVFTFDGNKTALNSFISNNAH
jgi:hypothetical protein